MFGGSVSTATVPAEDISTQFDEKLQLISQFSRGFATTALELIVTLSALLTADDQHRLGPILWNECLDSGDLQIIPSVSICFDIAAGCIDTFNLGVFSGYAMCRKVPRFHEDC